MRGKVRVSKSRSMVIGVLRQCGPLSCIILQLSFTEIGV